MPFFSTGHLWIIAIVLVIVLIIWGPGKLPDVGAGLGRAIREFRKASTETREEFAKAARYDDPPATSAPGSGPQAMPTSVPEATVPAAPGTLVHPATVGGGTAAAPAAEHAAGEGDHTSPV
jgi:TatA/E family protein of Tat protein translocase